MCELFGMSSRVAAEVNLSLEEFARHGGAAAPNRDGWGIAYYEDNDVRLIKEPGAASESPCVRFIENAHLASDLVIAHVRYATHGSVSLRNSQPFQRELGARVHVFAHNGNVAGVFQDQRLRPGRFQPIGETDSEYAFCCLLERLTPLYGRAGLPPLRARLQVFADFAREIAALGPANLLYSDGTTLFAHGHRRRAGPGQPLRPPGLHLLVRSCPREPTPHRPASGGVRIERVQQPQQVALLASVPLSAEDWQPLGEGTVVALEEGRIVARLEREGSEDHPTGIREENR